MVNLNSQRGFTLIEIITVIAVIALLTAVGVPSYAQMKRSVVFNNAVEEVVNDLRVAQSRALTANGGQDWGIHFETDSYTIYQGQWDPLTSGQTRVLPGGLTFDSATTPPEIVFGRLTGTTATNITVSFDGTPKTVSVLSTGSISKL